MGLAAVLASSVAAGEVVLGVCVALLVVLAGFVVRFAARASRRAGEDRPRRHRR